MTKKHQNKSLGILSLSFHTTHDNARSFPTPRNYWGPVLVLYWPSKTAVASHVIEGYLPLTQCDIMVSLGLHHACITEPRVNNLFPTYTQRTVLATEENNSIPQNRKT